MPNIIPITDLSMPQTALYAVRSETQLYHMNEPQNGYFIAESPNVVQRAIDGGYEPVSFLVETSQLHTISHLICDSDLPVYSAPDDVLKGITGLAMTRGVLCLMRRKDLPSVEDILAGKHRIAVLEDVMNPTNLGAIFRSAAALGMEGVILTGGCTDPLYRRAARVSMGTVFQVPWTFADAGWIFHLRNAGFHLAAMALKEDSVSIREMRRKDYDKLAIVLGTEGTGLKSETIAACDDTIIIPMTNGVDSLNVAAASAVAFYELSK